MRILTLNLNGIRCHRSATGDRATARKAWETAKAMIEEMGYHRRDGEVAEIEAVLNADGG
ncbi:MAG: hypothetical protein MOB07_20815 [Acidobacteria bacterium]|nr:hypothetical protein [Acidobacteriota bacterium]